MSVFHLTEHVEQLAHESRWLWLCTKCFLLANLLTVFWFGLLDPGSRVYEYTRASGGLDEFLFSGLGTLLVFLLIDFAFYDKSQHQRRHWLMEKFTPGAYMLLGAFYLGLAFVASLSGMGAALLVTVYAVNAVLSGAVAFAARIRLMWEAPRR